MIVLDQIIGCGVRHGNKYFLVRFKGQDRDEIIDWDAAKQYSDEVMEFFGSRTVWTKMSNIIDPDVCDDLGENDEQETETDEHLSRPSTSQLHQLDNCPNEINFEKWSNDLFLHSKNIILMKKKTFLSVHLQPIFFFK